jgi:N4-gp56 family major capsid protein
MPATSYVDVTEDEFGRVVIPTRKLSLMTLADVEPWIANAIAFNMAKTLDDGVRLELDATQNLLVNQVVAGATEVQGYYNGEAINNGAITSQATTGMSGEAIRTATTQFRATAVAPRFGAFYVGYIHPEVSHQLRTETGSNTWRTPHDYQDASALIAGELGSWEGVRFIETPNVTVEDIATVGKVYNSYILGAQALAEAVWKEPKIEFGNVTDKLNRFRPVGWHGILNWKLYRPQSLIKIQSLKA